MTDDDRRLADRLRRYESRVPVPHDEPAVRPRAVPWAALAGVAAVLVLAVALATTVLQRQPQVGVSSPSPGASESAPAALRELAEIQSVALSEDGRQLDIAFLAGVCHDFDAEIDRTDDVLEVTVFGTMRLLPSGEECPDSAEIHEMSLDLDPPFTGREIRDGATGTTFPVGVAAASTTPAPQPTPSPVPSVGPDPAFATPQIVMRASAEGTIQYVVGFATAPEGRIAAVSIADYAEVPATAPRPGRSAIYLERPDGTWEPIDTGSTFEGVDLSVLLSPPGGPMVAYGVAADNARPDMTGVWTSTDGRAWTEVQATWLGLTRHSRGTVIGGPRGYVQAGPTAAGLQVWWSADALSWELVHEVPDASIRDAAAGPEGFVIVGSDGSNAVSFASADGRTWFTSPPQASIDASDVLTMVSPIGPDWVAAGWRGEESEGIELWWSADGLSWEATGSIQPAGDMEPFGTRVMYPAHLESIGDRLFLSGAWAVEGSETRPLWIWTSTNGRDWELLELGGDAEIRAVSDAGCCVYLGGRIGRNTGEAIVWRWDPATR